MEQNQVKVQRLRVISSQPLQDVVASLDEAIGDPNMSIIRNEATSAQSCAELQAVVQKATGGSASMEFARYGLGEILRKKHDEQAPRGLRFVVGNPFIMARMVEPAPDAAWCAPATVLVDERPEGVHPTYDTMAGFLSRQGSPEALKVAEDLDSRIEALLWTAAHRETGRLICRQHSRTRQFVRKESWRPPAGCVPRRRRQ